MRGMLRILTLPDIHTPYNINLKPILNFCDDFNPHILQYLGDVTNAESCNWRKEMAGIKKDVETVEEDYDILLKTVIKPFKKTLPKSAKTNYFLGNHEDWFYQAMAKDWKAKHKYGVEDNIDIKKYGIRIIPRRPAINYGYLYYTHDPFHNLGQHHAKKVALYYRLNLVYGHSHDKQEFPMHSPLDETNKITAKSIGCLCKLNPDYLRDEPNGWLNSFHIAYIRPDGTFNDYTIVITGGAFTSPNGRLYK